MRRSDPSGRMRGVRVSTTYRVMGEDNQGEWQGDLGTVTVDLHDDIVNVQDVAIRSASGKIGELWREGVVGTFHDILVMGQGRNILSVVSGDASEGHGRTGLTQTLRRLPRRHILRDNG